jgi:DeoR/GlpR family transcriptional regulator of sugar metabolism
VVVADSSKFTAQAMCKILEPTQYDLLITDTKVDKKRVQRLRKKGIEIEIV